ncbi:DB module domain-containing protein [Ditylenchus destructor]|uniref:DB module domain-containing protein n=1 Tax=Ditylenchus destructor TaxID=166010 RepID=A0AAD4MQJ4_9BILA|nr:DB module domain-containing protein [Ditylenchus destructor]
MFKFVVLSYLVWCCSIVIATQYPNTIAGLNQCLKDKGITEEIGKDPSAEARTKSMNALIECYNGDKDNTECCQKAGITGNCLLMCNGVPPRSYSLDKFDGFPHICPWIRKCYVIDINVQG